MEDAIAEDPDEASALFQALMDAASPPSVRALTRRLRSGEATFEHPTRSSERCAMVEWYSVHANVAVKPQDSSGLEWICRYGLLSPSALHRLSLTGDGLVTYVDGA